MNKRLLIALAALAVMLSVPDKGEGGSAFGASGGAISSQISVVVEGQRLETPVPRGHYTAEPYVKR